MFKSLDLETKVKFLFSLGDCYKLISETIDKKIDLYSSSLEERGGILNALDEIMDLIRVSLPKLIIEEVNEEPHLNLVQNSRDNSVKEINDKHEFQ
ncbi:hypothetical protein [Legionella fairfieldensis]|uniref:hypothetical protein n=1 Tax=Legionella fairfieldensis TaxID=45064 RepID=UPI00048C37D8|nr:hypothetical protein [Legionella fairfieldensis]